MKLLKIFILLLININLVFTANILAIFQFPFYSHQFAHHKLMKEIAKRGHNLTIFTSHLFNYETFPNVVQHHFEESSKISDKYTDILEYKQKQLSYFQMSQREHKSFYKTTKREILHPEMQKIIKKSENQEYDLIMIECLFCHLVFLAEIYDCPVIFVAAADASFLWHGLMGNDVSPAIYPDIQASPFLRRHLTFFERIKSVFQNIIISLNWAILLINDDLKSQHFPNISMTLTDVLQKRCALLITNTNVAFGHVRPLMPNTVQIGFSHVEPPKEIEDKNIKEFLDKSTNGVIIMSFGSKADSKSFSLETVNKFLNVFNQTNFNVIWKSHQINQTVPQNLFFCNWLPLTDVLAHKNVKLLITHAGLMSAYEAIDREAPMIVFPLAYDHASNAKMMVNNKIAIELDFNDFSEKELLSAINEVTKKEYKENIKKLKEKVYDQPMKSLDLAVWHVESVLRNKNELKIPTSDFEEQFKRYYLDVIGIGIILIWIIKKLIEFIKIKIKVIFLKKLKLKYN